MTDDRQQDRRELDAARAALRSLVNALPSPAFIVDRGLTILMCNEALGFGLSLPVDQILGRHITELLPPALAEARIAWLRDVFESGRPLAFDDESGGRVWTNHVYPVLGAEGRVDKVAIFAVDVTDVRTAEAALRASEERLRATIYGTPDVAVQWYDAGGTIRLWNHASERVFGFTAAEAVGKTLADLIHTPEQFAVFMECLAEIARTGTALGPSEWSFRRRDGALGTCLSTIFMIPGEAGAPMFVCMDVDLTERKRVEAELRQAQKEEVLGRLAGGMAHDFNNLLTTIIGFAELGASRVAAGTESAECFGFVLEAAQRGATLTGNLLAFARKKVLAPRAVVLREVVDRLLPLMRPLIGEHIELVTRHSLDPEVVTVDVGGMEQVIMNLVVNARDAMPGGGRLTIETRAATIGENRAREAVPPGRYVLLEVRDTGVGVPSELHARVFEPFFTTKGVGHGTGLGLATSAGIVRQAGGYIGLESGPGPGTTFWVHLPVTTPSLDEVQAAREEPGEVRGRETVLVVEDEPSVRRLMERVLGTLGYRVLAASDANEALAAAAAHRGPIHVIVSDVVMPGMSGPELVEVLLAQRPETKVLLCTGYSSETDVVSQRHPMLAKPYTPAQLAQRVRETLDA